VGEYKVGDIVQLKSGGPKMTIDGIEEGEYLCKWFAGSKVEWGSFKPETLKPDEELKTILPE